MIGNKSLMDGIKGWPLEIPSEDKSSLGDKASIGDIKSSGDKTSLRGKDFWG